jgi:hypothetical protein
MSFDGNPQLERMDLVDALTATSAMAKQVTRAM